ncbi:MAG TPA: hypothetical protein DEB06_09170 [Phycisphaerales bacterium]|nr:hypothetical protein [Phycisphaerales bacterium]
MTATAKLLRLFLVDQQLRGLKSRLTAAERYLSQQDATLKELDAKGALLASQLRQLEATAKNDEVEISAIDQRVSALRERMNNSRTSKEHAALLTEISTLKADRGLIEERALGGLTKIDELRKQSEAVGAERAERVKVRDLARADRDARAAEIKDRVAELEGQRAEALKEVPKAALTAYDERTALGVDDVMAGVEEQDRRNMDYTCGSCYTHLPIEQVSILLRRGDLTTCPSCDAILYMEQTLREDITTSNEKKRKKSAAASAAEE